WDAHPLLANQDIGFPGARGWTLSLSRLEPIAFRSPFFPAWERSPYLNGGLLPPEKYLVRGAGGSASSIEEAWLPVTPLDTPVTRIAWERGALSLNAFQLRLRRMLTTRSYLALDYHSATADSQRYDYQFNVHQPYLGGWGFLGKLYPPIDRDSASLVLEDTSLILSAVNFRPRIGFWLDTGHVVEVFLDRVRNSSSLTYPRKPGAIDALGRADSAQYLRPASFSAYSGGLVHGWRSGAWSSQVEASASALEKSARGGDTLSSTGEDKWDGTLFRARGRVAAQGLFLEPYLEAETRHEAWKGRLWLPWGAAEEGWTDRQDVTLGLRPGGEAFRVEAEGGLTRNSRMENRVFWLPRGGARAEARLPFGLEASAGADYEERDPDWEILYRLDPASRLHPSPGLKARADFGLRGEVSWALPWLRLAAGADFLRIRDPWLPAILPSGNACAALADGAYGNLGAACSEALGLPDSLALSLVNWEREARDIWRMAAGLRFGHWALDVENHFLWNSEVEHTAGGTFANRMIPDRVFKGNLGWGRSLLDGKMEVSVGWGWEWFSTRYAWTPNLRGQSLTRKLDEYLALDFRAGMRIRTFLLHFRGANFNHDRYATEPGVHPPGVNFRFGIDWTLFN
ncbi:MAG TPA: hypothetical protein VK465_00270, partial [Fibrobacteria bacterium]|nr:hypothetical protein [Fibrobacteria bacterium]